MAGMERVPRREHEIGLLCATTTVEDNAVVVQRAGVQQSNKELYSDIVMN